MKKMTDINGILCMAWCRCRLSSAQFEHFYPDMCKFIIRYASDSEIKAFYFVLTSFTRGVGFESAHPHLSKFIFFFQHTFSNDNRKKKLCTHRPLLCLYHQQSFIINGLKISDTLMENTWNAVYTCVFDSSIRSTWAIFLPRPGAEWGKGEGIRIILKKLSQWACVHKICAHRNADLPQDSNFSRTVECFLHFWLKMDDMSYGPKQTKLQALFIFNRNFSLENVD